jgi:hypothetical protein
MSNLAPGVMASLRIDPCPEQKDLAATAATFRVADETQRNITSQEAQRPVSFPIRVPAKSECAILEGISRITIDDPRSCARVNHG